MELVDEKINQANGRLRASRMGVRICRRGNRLALKAIFPSKTGAGKPSQQIISLGIWANSEGIKIAESTARRVRVEIDSGNFTWEKYRRKSDEPPKAPTNTKSGFQTSAIITEKLEEKIYA